MKSSISIILKAIALSLTVISCKPEVIPDPEPTDPGPDEVILTPEAVILSESTSGLLITIDSLELVFSSTSLQLDTVEVGDVMVSGITQNAPYGFLRKVLQIDKSSTNSEVRYITSNASLTDVIVQGSVEENIQLKTEDILLVDSSGVDISVQRLSAKGLVFGIDLLLADHDGDYSTEGDQFRLKGEVEFGTDTEFDISFGILSRSLQSFKYEINLGMSGEFGAEIGLIPASLQLEEKYIIKSFQLTPMVILCGGVPIVFSRYIIIEAGVNGSIDGRFEVVADFVSQSSFGVEYTKTAGWKSIKEEEGDITVDYDILKVEASLEPYIGIRFEAIPFNIKKTNISLCPKISLPISGEFSLFPDYDISTDFCLGATFRAQMGIWDHSLAYVEKEILEKCWPLIQLPKTTYAVTPKEGGFDIDPETSISYVFSEPIRNWDNSAIFPSDLEDHEIIFLHDENGFKVPMSPTISGDKKTITLDPISPLQKGHTYTTGIVSKTLEDEDSNPILGAESTFTTKNDGITIPSIAWQIVLGGSNQDEFIDHFKTSDGGFVSGGYTKSIDGTLVGIHPNISQDAWVVKFDAQGVIEWQKTYGGSDPDKLYGITGTSDGGYVFVGTSQSDDGDVAVNKGSNDAWIVKLNSAGAIEWESTVGGFKSDHFNQVIQTQDGGFLGIGATQSSDGDIPSLSGDMDMLVVKVSSNGAIEYVRVFGGSDYDKGYDLLQAPNGNFVAVGISKSSDGIFSSSHGEHDAWILEFDANGNIIWSELIGGSLQELVYSLSKTNNGYIIGGSSESNDFDVPSNNGDRDAWLIRTDLAGQMIWTQTFGGSNIDNIYSAIQCSNGGYISVGYSQSSDGEINNHGSSQNYPDVWVIKTSESGIVEWQKNFGSSQPDYGKSIFELSPGEYIISGTSSSNDFDVSNMYGHKDAWVFKLTD